jgi:hypothetical protein
MDESDGKREKAGTLDFLGDGNTTITDHVTTSI